MRPCRWIVSGLLLTLSSCDVSTATVLVLQGRDKKSDSEPSGFAEPVFKAWIANLQDTAAADSERAALVAAQGRPSGPWTELGNFAATEIFDPSASPTSFNTILIQASSTQNYVLDCVEILDDQDRVLEHASGPTWSDFVDFPDQLLGAPDGKPAVTKAVGGSLAFIFTRYAGPIDRFRINGHVPSGPAPGDVVASGSFTSASNEKPGGMAIDANGLVHLTLTVGATVRLVRYDATGAFVDDVQIAAGITATQGSHSVALDSVGEIFTASTVTNGTVLVKQFHPNLNAGWSQGFSSGRASDRVEANGIAVDESGDVVVAGGLNSAGGGLNHWLAKVAGASGTILSDPRSWSDTAQTYWYGVTTGPGSLIYTTGDYLFGLFGGPQVLTGRFSPAGESSFLWADLYGDTDAPTDGGRAAALDSQGNLLVGGFLGTTPQGRNAVLLRYASNDTLNGLATYNGPANGDDEILDLAVDADGSVYAVGYESVSGQGQNAWVRKYVWDAGTSNFDVEWTRTHHGGFGNDRAISVALYGDQVVVAGFETVSGGLTKLVLRVYAK